MQARSLVWHRLRLSQDPEPYIHVRLQVHRSAAALLAGGTPERDAHAPRRRGWRRDPDRGDRADRGAGLQASMALGAWVFESVWQREERAAQAEAGARSFGFTLVRQVHA